MLKRVKMERKTERKMEKIKKKIRSLEKIRQPKKARNKANFR